MYLLIASQNSCSFNFTCSGYISTRGTIVGSEAAAAPSRFGRRFYARRASDGPDGALRVPIKLLALVQYS